MCYLESLIPIKINGYLQFGLYGVIFMAVNTMVALLIGLVFNKKITLSLIKRVKGMLKIKY